MTEQQLYDLLKTTGLEVAYDHFKSETGITPPFITYRNNETNYVKADDLNYHQDKRYIIDLVTDEKDIVTEKVIEDLLNLNHLQFDKFEDYISSEKIYQIRYII